MRSLTLILMIVLSVALTTATTCADEPVSTPRQALTAGIEHQKAKRYAEAERAFRRAIELVNAETEGDPGTTQLALESLGSVLLNMGRHDDAQPFLELNLEFAVGLYEDGFAVDFAHELLADCELARGNYAAAASSYERIGGTRKARAERRIAAIRLIEPVLARPPRADAIATLRSQLAQGVYDDSLETARMAVERELAKDGADPAWLCDVDAEIELALHRKSGDAAMRERLVQACVGEHRGGG